MEREVNKHIPSPAKLRCSNSEPRSRSEKTKITSGCRKRKSREKQQSREFSPEGVKDTLLLCLISRLSLVFVCSMYMEREREHQHH